MTPDSRALYAGAIVIVLLVLLLGSYELSNPIH